MKKDVFCPALKAGAVPALEPGQIESPCDSTDYSTKVPGALDILGLYTKTGPSIVLIDSKSAGGTGFFVGHDGEDCLIITDNHAVPESNVPVVDNLGEAHFAEVRKRDLKNDLALLTSKLKFCPVLPQAETLPPDEHVVSIGHPEKFARAFVSEVGTYVGQKTRLQLADSKLFYPPLSPGEDAQRSMQIFRDLRVPGGYSGGPIFNSKGEVVSAVSGVNAIDDHFYGFATPISAARRLTEQYLAEKAH